MIQNPQIVHSQKTQLLKQISPAKSQPYIGNFEQTPQYMRDDKLYVGYRINFHSYGQVLKSLFQLHNQTVNIWTHFGGAIIMIFAIISVCYFQFQDQSFSNGFEKIIVNFSPQKLQCPAQMVHFIDQALLHSNVEQKLSEKICHSHGQHYFGQSVCQIAAQQISLIKNYFIENFGQDLKRIEHIKLHWQKQVIPNIFHQIERKANFSVFNFIKENIQKLQVKMDQQQFEYLQFGQHGQNPQRVSRFPLIVYLFCGIIALVCSTVFHLFNPMSRRAYNISISLDYAGINVFLAGSSFPAFYYGMYCYFDVAYFYMTIIMLIGITIFILSLTDWFRRPENFIYKSICYGGFGFFYLIPMAHLAINEIIFNNYGDKFSFLPSLHWYLLAAVSDFMGLYIFAKRCPDRNHPGKYDVCGHSHQLWHSFVLLGMLFEYLGACTNYQSRKQFSCPIQF